MMIPGLSLPLPPLVNRSRNISGSMKHLMCSRILSTVWHHRSISTASRPPPLLMCLRIVVCCIPPPAVFTPAAKAAPPVRRVLSGVLHGVSSQRIQLRPALDTTSTIRSIWALIAAHLRLPIPVLSLYLSMISEVQRGHLLSALPQTAIRVARMLPRS